MVDFNEERHEYSEGGIIIPNVTTVLKNAGLIDDEYFTEEGRRRGNAVHAATHYYDDGDLDEGSVAQEYLGYLEGYKRFLFEVEPEWDPDLVERIIHNRECGYIGRLDRGGRMFRRPSILDIKTGQSDDFYVGPQTAAYERPLRSRDRYTLRLKPNGTYKLKPHKDPDDFKVFLWGLALHNWKKNKGG